jgi:hypothetical protein
MRLRKMESNIVLGLVIGLAGILVALAILKNDK